MKHDTAITAILTLVIWSLCLAVGVTGAVLPPERPAPPPPPEPLPPVQLIKVELTDDPFPEVSAAAQPSAALPLPLPDSAPPPPVHAPAMPQAIPVAAPNQVAFALPVEGPTIEVEASQAAYAAPLEKPVADETAPAAPAPPAPQRLTYGSGQGRQPKPVYPYQAQRRNQTGVVRVRFTVGADGRVSSAEAVSPCEWPLLNDSAVSTIRNRWRFLAGPVRIYEVDIRFELRD